MAKEWAASGLFGDRQKKASVYGIILHHTRKLLLSGITHTPLILSINLLEIIVYMMYCGIVASFICSRDCPPRFN